MESRREERSTLMLSNNKFKVLISKVMNMRILSKEGMRKNRKTILKEEKLKKRKKEKISRGKKDKKRKIVKRSDDQDRIETEE